MATQGDWRTALSASERFSNIQNIETAVEKHSLSSSAFTLENEAYLSSVSRDDYDAACLLLARQTLDDPSDEGLASNESKAGGAGMASDEAGVDIGTYKNCAYIASGASADVYRSGKVALKVITCGADQAPHNPHREAKILKDLSKPCIPLLSTFYDTDRQLVLAFPFMPLTLESLLRDGVEIPRRRLVSYFMDIFSALVHIHDQGIIHRDIKPSAVLLESIDGPAYLSDFGTAWHPTLSPVDEPADQKILDVGTGPYRAPETLFGDQSYGPPIDMWGAGVMLAECARPPPAKAIFESRATHEDGNQLGLILSIFKTVGTPTMETWPQAASFKTPPFQMYRVFEARTWEDILPDIDPDIRDLVSSLVKYNSSRLSATEALLRVSQLPTEEASTCTR